MLLQLKQNIEENNPDGSMTIYPADGFGLAAIATIDPISEVVSVAISVRNLESKKIAYHILQQTYTVAGHQGEMINKKEYESYLQNRETLISEVKQLQTELKNARNVAYNAQFNSTDKQNKLQAVEDIETTKAEKETVLANLVAQEIKPIFSQIDTFSEVKDYFPTGSLTNEGLAWIKNIKFKDGRIGDYTQL